MKKETAKTLNKAVVLSAGEFPNEEAQKQFEVELQKENKKGSKLLILENEDVKVVILKAKITNALTLEGTFTDSNKKRKIEINFKNDAIIHKDLQAAFNYLRVHMAFMCDLKEAVKLNFDEYVEEQMRIAAADYVDPLANIKVTGFTVSGSEDGEGVTLTGTKQIGNKVLNLNTPFTKFENDDYPYISELQIGVLLCSDEVKEYLNGKAAQKQLEMKFTNEDKTEVF